MKANCHIHLPPNFSAFASTEDAIGRAKGEGLAILGASNYYDHRIYAAFMDQCRSAGMWGLAGIEIVCWHEPSAREGAKINDPGNPGKMYLCGKALARLTEPTPRAQELLAEIREGDEARMNQMVGLLNEACRKAGVAVELDHEELKKEAADRAGVPPEAVTLQERHLAQGLQDRINQKVDDDSLPAAILNLLGAESKNPASATGLQGEIRTHLMKAGKPAYAPEKFISFSDAMELIRELEGTPAYPVVFDGMKPWSEFESSAEGLAARLREMKIDWVEFIPNRNSSPVLNQTVKALVEEGFWVSAGTEHNTTDMAPLVPQCQDGSPMPEAASLSFWKGAVELARRQHGARAARDLEAHV